jgi:spore maturation protein CgeB
LYNSAKIVIGDSVYSPQYWSNRIYETLGRGGFLIHPNVPGIEKEYEPWKEFIPYDYNDFTSLKEKIDYFLTKPKEREKIQMAGFIKTRDYILEERCRSFLKLVQ